MIKSVPAWLVDFQLQLTSEESELIKTYKEAERTLCTFTNLDGNESSFTVGQAITGHKGHVCKQLAHAQTLRDSVIHGCAALRDHLRAIIEIRAGGGEQIIDIPLYPQQSAQPPTLPPQIQAQ